MWVGAGWRLCRMRRRLTHMAALGRGQDGGGARGLEWVIIVTGKRGRGHCPLPKDTSRPLVCHTHTHTHTRIRTHTHASTHTLTHTHTHTHRLRSVIEWELIWAAFCINKHRSRNKQLKKDGGELYLEEILGRWEMACCIQASSRAIYLAWDIHNSPLLALLWAEIFARFLWENSLSVTTPY